MLEVIPRLVAEGVNCDACVCDPPYHLLPTVKRFGAAGNAPARHGRDGAMARLSGGFMNQQWDGGDMAFRPETWTTVATILRPGAFLLAFGGTRTYHRLACAIEDAGFVIQDQIGWVFGSGFPKRRDMLKPAWEPICLAYKPGGRRTMQVDECRIPIEDVGGSWGNDQSNGPCWGPGRRGGAREPEGKRHEAGRWPANLVLDGSDEVMGAFPEAPGQQRSVGPEHGAKPRINVFGDYGPRNPFAPRGDHGSAARFFYHAKADKSDRAGSRHPTVKPIDLMRWLVTLVTPPGGLVIDPFAGSGTTGVAGLAAGRNTILIEREHEYVSDIRERLTHYEGEGRHSLASRNRKAKDDGKVGPLFG